MIKVKRLIKSFRYAIKGLVKTFREEQNLKIQTFFAAMAIIIGIAVGLPAERWMVLLLVIALVLLMEIVNSALERVSDVLKPRINSYVKEIKDIMAAAVMLSAVTAIIVGLIIFWPYFSSN